MRRALPAALFILYCLVLIDVMVFKYIPTIHIGHLILRFGGGTPGPANLVPFTTIVPYLLGEKGSIIDLVELLGNIVPLVPIGLLAPFVFERMNWQRALVLAVAAGLSLEGMQVLFRVGIFDIDDVLLNGLGVLIGHWLVSSLSLVHRPLLRSEIEV